MAVYKDKEFDVTSHKLYIHSLLQYSYQYAYSNEAKRENKSCGIWNYMANSFS